MMIQPENVSKYYLANVPFRCYLKKRLFKTKHLLKANYYEKSLVNK